MKQLAEEEVQRWLNGLAEFNEYNRNVILSLFSVLGVPKTYLDVGCGNGTLVEVAKALGSNAHGIDILPLGKPYFHQLDLTDPIDLECGFDVVTSIEVAEHVDPIGSDNYCDTLVKHLNPGGVLVITAAPPGQPGDGHVNCVLPDTLIDGNDDTIAAMRHWYTGKVITLVTASGNELTVTPNHPILTRMGYLPASKIQLGENVVCGVDRQGIPFGVAPNYNERPTMVKEIFGAFQESNPSGFLSVPGTPKDFHGDGSYGEVSIVLPNRSLPVKYYAQLGKHICEPVFESGQPIPSLVSIDGSPTKNIEGIFFSNPSQSHNFSALPSFIKGESGIDNFVTSGNISKHASVLDNSPYGILGYGKGFGDFNTRLPRYISGNGNVGGNFIPSVIRNSSEGNSFSGKNFLGGSEINMGFVRKNSQRLPVFVSLDEVVKIKQSNFSGHVYNLSTEKGWYISNNIITHNCQPAEWWRERMFIRGMSYTATMTYRIQLAWSIANHSMHWLEGNLQVFLK